jgi:DNA-binding response OmpR family regulator
MGGHIEVRSQPGEGSTFTVSLPWRVTRPDRPSHSISSDGDEDETTLLLCTDDPGMIDLTGTHLFQHGIDVRHVDQPEMVPAVIAREPAAAVLIDVNLPAAPDVLRYLAMARPPAGRVWLTAWTEDHQLGFLIPLDGILANPQVLSAPPASPSLDPYHNTALVLVRSECPDDSWLHDSLARLGWTNIRTASSAAEAITELTSGDVETIFVGVGQTDNNALQLAHRVRRIPEWAPVRIMGVVSPREDDDQTDKTRRSLDRLIGRHGMTIPTLLLDIAESLRTLRPSCSTDGVHT